MGSELVRVAGLTVSNLASHFDVDGLKPFLLVLLAFCWSNALPDKNYGISRRYKLYLCGNFPDIFDNCESL